MFKFITVLALLVATSIASFAAPASAQGISMCSAMYDVSLRAAKEAVARADKDVFKTKMYAMTRTAEFESSKDFLQAVFVATDIELKKTSSAEQAAAGVRDTCLTKTPS